jgi:hypothetical protein
MQTTSWRALPKAVEGMSGLILATCIVLVGGCKPREVVVGATPDPRSCQTCLVSKRDNPTVQGTVELEVSRGPVGNRVEEVERDGQGFIYSNFQLTAAVKGDDGKGASDLDLIPAPYSPGSWQADEEPPAEILAWELHGMELGYAVSEATVRRRNAYGAASFAPQSPIKVSLDKNVILVPLQIIRVIPADTNAPTYSTLQKYSTSVHKKYWDRRWDLDTANLSEPGVPFKASLHSVNATELPWANADDIWSQCGIQFRMLSCNAGKTGCPDLKVTDPAQIQPTAVCKAGFSAEASQSWNEAANLPGVDRDLPIVTFTYRVTAPSCPATHLSKSLRGAMGYAASFGNTDYTLAHELGHVLGLRDSSQCSGDAAHLMCAEEGGQTTRITPDDCKKARSNAAIYAKRRWGVTIAP